MKMRGMVTAKSVDERTTPAMPVGVSPFQFGPTTIHLVGACVVHRDRPETVAKVGHLNDHGLFFERQVTQPVNDILVRVCDEPLARINVCGQHTDLIHRANRHDACEEPVSGTLVSWVRWLYT
jgi:hypothetical protein